MALLQRLGRLPMSRPQWRLLFQGRLGYTFDGMDVALVAFILPSATAVFSPSSSSASRTLEDISAEELGVEGCTSA